MCKCGSERIARISAKCADSCCVTMLGCEIEGYVPDGLGIGRGDYVEFSWCLNCGLIQDDFPLPKDDELGDDLVDYPEDEVDA